MKRVNRLRMLAWLGAFALITLPIVLVTEGGFGAERWPYRQLVSHGAFQHVSEQQVKQLAQPLLKRGYFGADLASVKAALEALPWVEQVEVRKSWPDLLDISVFEREPVARWNKEHLLSRKGDVFTVPADQLPPGLPDLHGPDARASEVLASYRETSETLRSAGLLVTAVAMSERGSWRFWLANGGELRLGDDPDLARQHLQRFVSVFRELPGADPARLKSVDLRYANGFSVAWAPAAAARAPDTSAVPALPATTETPKT